MEGSGRHGAVYTAVLIACCLWCTPVAFAAPQPTSSDGIDWASGAVRATGLGHITRGPSVGARAAASDMAAANAALALRRMLYRLPVTSEAMLGTVLIRFPTLEPLLGKTLLDASRESQRVIAPDLIELRLALPLAPVRRILAPVLMGKAPEGLSKRAGDGPAEAASPKESRGLVVLPPEGTNYTPGLLPLLKSRDVKRALRLESLVARQLLAGATVAHPATAPEGKTDYLVVTADSVGGLAGASLVLGDAVADRIIEFLAATPAKSGFEFCLPRHSSRR